MKPHLTLFIALTMVLAGCEREHAGTVHVGGRLPSIALELADGSTYKRAAGTPVVISFVYSRCADICPLTLAALKQVHKSLAPEDSKVQFLLITVDPDRDRGAAFEAFLDSYEPSFVGLTGAPVQVHELLHALGARFEKSYTTSADGYSMKHSADVILADGRGMVRQIFPFGTSTETIINAVKELK